MPFAARSEFHKLGKGSFMFGLWSGQTPPSSYAFAGNVQSVSLSADPTNAEIFSNTEKSGALVDRRPLRTAFNLAVNVNEFTKDNLLAFLMAEEASRAQQEASGFEHVVENIELGRYYPLNRRRMQDIEVFTEGSSALVSGTDYEINTEFGMFRAIPGGAIAEGSDVSIYGAQPALTITQLRIAQNSAPVSKLEFLCDDANNEGSAAKDHLKVWKASIAPEGELQFVGDDYGNFTLNFTILSDATNHPDDPYGVLERIES